VAQPSALRLPHLPRVDYVDHGVAFDTVGRPVSRLPGMQIVLLQDARSAGRATISLVSINDPVQPLEQRADGTSHPNGAHGCPVRQSCGTGGHAYGWRSLVSLLAAVLVRINRRACVGVTVSPLAESAPPPPRQPGGRGVRP